MSPAMSKPKTTHRGVTLLEVVISIAVATIGLLAAVALLPVAGVQLENGKTADSAAAIGEAAVASAHVIGAHNPQQWRTLVYDPGTSRYYPRRYGPDTVDGYGYEVQKYDAGVLWRMNSGNPTYLPRPTTNAPVTGFVVDGFLLGDSALRDPANAGALSDGAASVSGAPDIYALQTNASYDLQLFPYYRTHPFDDGGAPSTIMYNMRRVSLGGVAGAFAPTTSALAQAQSERLFTVTDDLILKESSDGSLPAMQAPSTLIQTINGNTYQWSMKRDSQNDFSWMATFAPLMDVNNASTYGSHLDANNQIGNSAAYTMSVVVQRRRTPPRLNIVPGANPLAARYIGASAGNHRNGMDGAVQTAEGRRDRYPADEMVATIQSAFLQNNNNVISDWPPGGMPRGFLTGGFGGGEVLIESPLNNRAPLDALRAGGWVMLSGYVNGASTNGGTSPPSRLQFQQTPNTMVRHQWYRIVSVGEVLNVQSSEVVGQDINNNPIYRTVSFGAHVTLEGPDWQVSPFVATNPRMDHVQVTVVPAVVSVFEKTVNLAFPLQ